MVGGGGKGVVVDGWDGMSKEQEGESWGKDEGERKRICKLSKITL
ncbi:hypothetical protein A2U01_0065505, partial [Trifolium medium]|nr:hypothetical protein [Trifolium medium]